MKIESVQILNLEAPRSEGKPLRRQFIEVKPDAGITSRCVTDTTPEEAERLRQQVLGEDPLQRERLFQTLYLTRHVRRGWSGAFASGSHGSSWP